MEFNQAREAVKGIVFETVRVDGDKYFEAVIVNDNLPALTDKLDTLFGKAVWPGKNRLTAGIENTINDFGGVQKGQTLYFCQQTSRSVFAMLWPWQDNRRITLKIAQK